MVETTNIAVSKDIVNKLRIEAAMQQARLGKPVTIRDLAEAALNKYLEGVERYPRPDAGQEEQQSG